MSRSPARRLADLVCPALAAGLILGLVPSAHAAPVVFDFGTLVATGSSCLSGDCVLGSASQSFTTGGVTVGADSFAVQTGGAVTSANTDVSQRLGLDSSGETGLGVYSNGANGVQDSTTGSPLEISSSEYLLIDNSTAIANGYLLTSISLSSIQSGEGGMIDVYGASSVTGTLNLNALTQIAVLQNLSIGPGVVQTYTFNPPTNDTYLVITADNTTNSAGNVLVQQESFTVGQTTHQGAIPEPSSLALLASFALTLVALGHRRRAI